jgi:hypothetical protein
MLIEEKANLEAQSKAEKKKVSEIEKRLIELSKQGN